MIFQRKQIAPTDKCAWCGHERKDHSNKIGGFGCQHILGKYNLNGGRLLDRCPCGKFIRGSTHVRST